MSVLPWLAALVLVGTTYLSALNLALIQVSQSLLERRLVDAGRVRTATWLVPRVSMLAQGVALLRTFGRVGFFALVLAGIVGVGESVAMTAANLTISVVLSASLLWILTSVLASAIAEHAAVGVVAASVPVLRAVHTLTLPLSWLVRGIDEGVRRLAGAATPDEQAEDELLHSIEDTQRQGGLDPAAAALLENVVEFTSTAVGAVMTPRTEMQGLAYTDDLAAIRAAIVEDGHSRIPVYRESLDDIVGILYVKDLVRYLGEEPEHFRLQPLLRAPIRVPETKRVSELLRDFQRSEVHLAIVIDEYGGTSGLVTIEDVLEEIVGEIRDEHEAPVAEDPELRRISERVAEVDGRCRVADLNAELGLELPEDEGFDTIAGLMLARLGRVPEPGETLEVAGGAKLTVLEATPTQIVRIRVDLPEVPAVTE